jgi:hypothetical protein
MVLPYSAPACKCAGSASVCTAVLTSDLVFIGTVESIEPSFIDPWDPSFQERLDENVSVEEFDGLEQDQTPEGIAKIKKIYLDVFPDMPESYKRQFADAKTYEALEALWEYIINNVRVHFKAKETFRGPNEKSFDVWTDFGIRFLKGETYLVYANQEEETKRFRAGGCSRTSRLSDAGDDLAYLFFLKNVGTESSRFYGFVTSNEVDLRTPRFWDSINSPVPEVVVELNSASGKRLTETDQHGRFVFDGLGEGEYSVFIYASHRPIRLFGWRAHATSRSKTRRALATFSWCTCRSARRENRLPVTLHTLPAHAHLPLRSLRRLRQRLSRDLHARAPALVLPCRHAAIVRPAADGAPV